MKTACLLRIGLLVALLLPVAPLRATERAEETAYRYGALGRLNEMQGKNTEALDYFNQSLAIKPDSIIYSNRAELKRKLQDFAGAIADYDKAIALNSGLGLKPADLATLHFTRGLLKQQLGDLEGSIADYDKVISLIPDSALAYNNRGYARITQRDHTGAIADYSMAVELQPKTVKFRDNLANAKRDMGDLAGAIDDYDQIVGMEPGVPLHSFNRGNLKQLRGDFAGAIVDYNKVIELRPSSWGGYLQRGTARQSQGDLEAAFADYDRAVTMTNDHLAYGWAYREIVLRQLKRGTPNDELTRIVSKGADGFPKNIGLFLSGSLSEAVFLAGAQTSSERCIAFYFAGMSRLLAGDQAVARNFLDQSVATKRLEVIELVLARAELGRLALPP